MAVPGCIFDQHSDFHPEGGSSELEALIKRTPARWAVYLFADAEDRPIQLLCVKNLRYSLKRRLGGQEPIGPTRRINYQEVVRGIYWRRVDSALEADWIYLEAARSLFPASYKGMVGFRPAWFIHVDPQAQFPRYVKATDLSKESGAFIGPIEDKHSAARLIEMLEDAFELCRYYNVLLEAPHGRACAYKEMGKCPAPCDGSISMERYRQTVASSVATAVDPAGFLREQEVRMRQASAALQFEQAAKIKGAMERLSQLGKGPFRHVRRLENFAFLSLQRGPRAGVAKLFLVVRGQIEEIAGIIDQPDKVSDLLRFCLVRATELSQAPMTTEAVERIGIVAHHLFLPKQSHGAFIPLDRLNDHSLSDAWRDLRKQKQEPEEIEGEGVVKELQAM